MIMHNYPSLPTYLSSWVGMVYLNSEYQFIQVNLAPQDSKSKS